MARNINDQIAQATRELARVRRLSRLGAADHHDIEEAKAALHTLRRRRVLFGSMTQTNVGSKSLVSH